MRPANGHLSLLATGDSMIQIIDGFLAQRLQSDRVTVHSDARISTGISKPFLLNWPFHAKQQARRLRPDVTVVFIGANDGFPLHGVNCCGRDWIKAYARRVSGMMASYARRGAGSVYWATLPAPAARASGASTARSTPRSAMPRTAIRARSISSGSPIASRPASGSASRSAGTAAPSASGRPTACT